MKDYYALLGVQPNVDQMIIEAVYNAWIARDHINNAGETGYSSSRLADLSEAYQVLSDPIKREDYNRIYRPNCEYALSKQSSEYRLLEDANFVVDSQNDINQFECELKKENIVVPAGVVLVSVVVLFLSYFAYTHLAPYWHSEFPMQNYLDHGDGTVTDEKTQLQWMRCSVGQTWKDNTCQGEVRMMSWWDANLVSQVFADHCDWRLPTREELMTLVYCSKGSQAGDGMRQSTGCQSMSQIPAIDTQVFVNTDSRRCAYWSSSDDDILPNSAWTVCFNYGSDTLMSQQSLYSVRLVRAL